MKPTIKLCAYLILCPQLLSTASVAASFGSPFGKVVAPAPWMRTGRGGAGVPIQPHPHQGLNVIKETLSEPRNSDILTVEDVTGDAIETAAPSLRQNHDEPQDIKAVAAMPDAMENATAVGLVDDVSGVYKYYNWTEFLPQQNGLGGIWKKARWLITGATLHTKQSPEEVRDNLSALARLLILLRAYKKRFGVPTVAGPVEQRKLIADIITDLYSSGTSTWALETVMERVTEGMTGREGTQFMLFPRRCLIYYPASFINPNPATDMVKLKPGYDIARMNAVEQVAVRLASFAGNTKTAERVNPEALRMPSKQELVQAKQEETRETVAILNQENHSPIELAEEILNLASSTYGLFYFLNNPKFQAAINVTDEDDVFWEVSESTRDTFTRLAADAAGKSMKYIHDNEKELYSKELLILCRVVSAAGACGMWFGGSVPDMIVSGILALAVHKIGTSQALAYEERVLTEVVSSFVVGMSAGLLALKWPDTFCFGAIAVASVMDLLQGFKVSYGVIEVMSKNIVTGAARMFEGILFTGLISYSIRFGLDFAFRLMFGQNLTPKDYSGMLMSAHGISMKWFPLLLPFTATAWSILFWPGHRELPWMAWHGILAFTLNMAGFSTFLSAMCVTFSAGLISRFTGRGALGMTLAGLYALVPGTYMVKALLAPSNVGFIERVLTAAATIGIGGWTGTLLCSPTIMGKTSGLHGWSFMKKTGESRRENLLYF